MTSEPELRFDDRVAIVTGAGTGIGRAHARLLADRGAAVVVNDVNRESAHEVVHEIEAAGGRARAVVTTVATEAGADAIAQVALEAFGGIDIVVNNAGLLRSRPFADLTLDEWNEVLAVGLTGAFLVTRAAWAPLAAGGSGRVVFTTSNSGLLGTAGSAAYAAAKAGLWGLIRTLAIEGHDVGISVNGLAPMAYTSMSAQSRNAPESWRDGTGDAWSRRLDVERVAPVAAWLCHADCPLNGEVLSAVGGRVARFFVGLTEGVVHDDLAIEHVRDDLASILDTDDHSVLGSAFDEGRELYRRLRRADAPGSSLTPREPDS